MPYKIVKHPNGCIEKIQTGPITAKEEREYYASFTGKPSLIPSANYRAKVRREQKKAALET